MSPTPYMRRLSSYSAATILPGHGLGHRADPARAVDVVLPADREGRRRRDPLDGQASSITGGGSTASCGTGSGAASGSRLRAGTGDRERNGDCGENDHRGDEERTLHGSDLLEDAAVRPRPTASARFFRTFNAKLPQRTAFLKAPPTPSRPRGAPRSFGSFRRKRLSG